MIIEVMTQLFGVYQPIDGCADWGYISSVGLFAIVLIMALYALAGVLKRK